MGIFINIAPLHNNNSDKEKLPSNINIDKVQMCLIWIESFIEYLQAIVVELNFPMKDENMEMKRNSLAASDQNECTGQQ